MVEIFIEPELAELEQPLNAQEWFDICTKLGLSQQISHADRSEQKKAPPYMHVDAKTSRIIKTLCPVQVEYTAFKVSTIPLDVLKEISKAVDNGWYRAINICYDDKSPDPFVVGLTHSESKWQSDIHLIARWGAELLPFEVLEDKAVARMKQQASVAVKELRAKLDIALEDMDTFCNNLLGGSNVPTISFSVNEINKW